MALVDVIIPTHKGREAYVLRLLEALNQQTMTDFRVLVGDNDYTKTQPPDYVNQSWSFDICYTIQPEDLGPHRNIESLLARCEARYIKPMMSDDLISSDYMKVATDALNQQPTVNLFFARRQFINENDQVTGEANYHGYEKKPSGIVSGQQLITDSIKCFDWFPGEPTNIMMKNNHIPASELFISFTGKSGFSYKGSFDLIWYLKALEHGDAYFYNQPLSQIRKHDGRALTNPIIGLICRLDYYYFALDAHHLGLIEYDVLSDAMTETMRYIWYQIFERSWVSQNKSRFLLIYIHEIIQSLQQQWKAECSEHVFFQVFFNSLEILISECLIGYLIAKKMPVYVYGAGTFVNRLFEKKHPLCQQIIGFIVSDTPSNSNKLFNLPIISLNQVVKSNGTYILIASSFKDDISKSLKEGGYQLIEDFYYFPYPD